MYVGSGGQPGTQPFGDRAERQLAALAGVLIITGHVIHVIHAFDDRLVDYSPRDVRHIRQLGLEPGQCAMVAAHAFDVMGARACGYRGVYVNRYSLPYEETPFQPDVTVQDFSELPEALL